MVLELELIGCSLKIPGSLYLMYVAVERSDRAKSSPATIMDSVSVIPNAVVAALIPGSYMMTQQLFCFLACW